MMSSDAGALAPLCRWFLRRRLEAPSSRALAGGGCGATDASASKACSGACARRAQTRLTHTHAQPEMTCAPAGLVRVAPAQPARSAAPAARPMKHRRAAMPRTAPAARSAAPAARRMKRHQAAMPRPAPAARSAAPAARSMKHRQTQATRGLGASPAHNHVLHACTYTNNTTTRTCALGPNAACCDHESPCRPPSQHQS